MRLEGPGQRGIKMVLLSDRLAIDTTLSVVARFQDATSTAKLNTLCGGDHGLASTRFFHRLFFVVTSVAFVVVDNLGQKPPF